MCIDKLDVRISRRTPFTPEFQEVYRHAAIKGLLKPSSYYGQTGDFRTYGYEIRLHMYAHYGKHDHKLELYDTGEMRFDQMIAEIRRVFICDPFRLEMMRRDVCVDVKGMSLNWFKTHTRVEYKRNLREIGYMRISKRRGETLYLGEKPNQFRIYDKAAERLHQYAHMCREAKKADIPVAPFEEVFRHSESALITRVERQYGGSRCGGNLRSLLRLDWSNPFEPLKFLKSSAPEISPVGIDSTTYWAAQHLQRMVCENGAQYVRAHMSDLVGSKNVKKTWDKFSPFILPKGDAPEFDEKALHQLYLKSIMQQLGSIGSKAYRRL